MCYIVFISDGLHWRSVKVASFEYVIMHNTPCTTSFIVMSYLKLLLYIPNTEKDQKKGSRIDISSPVQVAAEQLITYIKHPYIRLRVWMTVLGRLVAWSGLIYIYQGSSSQTCKQALQKLLVGRSAPCTSFGEEEPIQIRIQFSGKLCGVCILTGMRKVTYTC